MLIRLLPFLEWFKDYSPQKAKCDFLAGLTVALVLIPQSMAYAQLAGLPAYYGLYASLLPPVVAALFGSSRQLATGPVAVVSLMTAACLSPLAATGSEGFILYAIMLAFTVGVFQILLGVLRLGLIVNFISHPVVAGFTNAAAIIIATSQLSKFFGITVDPAQHHYETILRVLRSAVHYTHVPSLIFGTGAFLLIMFLKKKFPKPPGVLIAVAIATTLSWAMGYEQKAAVPLESIHSAEARTLVTEYNALLKEMATHTAKRTEYSLTAADETHNDWQTRSEASFQHSMEQHSLDTLEAAAEASRSRLRGMLFERVSTPEGERYFPQGEIPANLTSNGNIWRLKVGGKPIPLGAVSMTGGGDVIGTIPGGLPPFRLPPVDAGHFLRLLPYAVIIALLGFMEAISIAKAMAAKTGQRLDPNRELIGQGLANIAGSLTGAYPSSGSFSRSAVNLQAGAVTGMSSLFTSLAVLMVLLWLTPLLYHLPSSVLAAVIMSAVMNLISPSSFKHAYKANKADGIISCITFVATLLVAPHLDKGIMLGAGLSLAIFLYKSMRPHVAYLSLYEDNSHKDAVLFGLSECQYLSVVRFDGALFFANATYLEEIISNRRKQMPELKHIVIKANGINYIDASGEETLALLRDRLSKAGIGLSLCGVKEPVMEVLKRTHFYQRLGAENFHITVAQAVCSAHRPEWHSANEKCPLTSVCHIPASKDTHTSLRTPPGGIKTQQRPRARIQA